MARPAFLILLLSVFVHTSVLMAQSQEEGSLGELSIEDLMNLKVISSTQESVPFLETPSTVFLVTGDQIRRWGIRRLSDLIERLVPGAMAAEDFDDVILAFRGITSDNNLKVLLLLNGHEYNTQWNNGPSSEAELGLLDDIDKVEVLNGPHTALYGSPAIIAVINMITKNGRDFSGVQVAGNYGTGEYVRAGLVGGERVNDDLDYFLSVGALNALGYDNNNNEPLNISRFPLSWRFYGNVNYKKFEFMSRFTRSCRAFYIQQASEVDPNKWTNYDTFFVTARRTFQRNENLTYQLDLSYDAIQTQRHDYTLGTKLRAVGEDRFGAKFTTFYSPWEKHHFVLGGYYRRDEFGDDWEGDNFDFDTLIVDGEVTGIPADPYTRRVVTPYGRNVYALFAEDSIKLSEHFSLLLGFRYDRVEAPQIESPNSYSPRIALIVTPTKKTVLKAMYTAGVARQINAANTSPDAIAFGNQVQFDAEKPERLDSFELDASYQPTPSTYLALNTYYNSLSDIFGVDPAVEPPPYRLINYGRIDYVGFEAIASANFTPGTLVRLVQQHVQFGSVVRDIFNFLPTPDKKHPSNYPEDVTKILADVQINKYFSVNGSASLIWNNYGSDAEGNTQNTGFYSLVNANFIWEPKPSMEIMLSVYNLLDKQMQIPPFYLLSQLPERSFNVNVSYHF